MNIELGLEFQGTITIDAPLVAPQVEKTPKTTRERFRHKREKRRERNMFKKIIKSRRPRDAKHDAQIEEFIEIGREFTYAIREREAKLNEIAEMIDDYKNQNKS